MIELTIGRVFKKVHYRHICDQDSDKEWTRIIEETLPKGRIISWTNNPNTRRAFRDHGYQVNPIPIQAKGINATGIRKLIIRNEPWQEFVPFGTREIITKIREGLYSPNNID